MSRLFFCSLTLSILVVAQPVHADEPSASTLRIEQQQDGVLIVERDSPVLFYQTKMKSKAGKWPRANYVHPLYDLDGRVVTEDFPADHGHHRGIFWTWHQVLIGEQQIGDAWECKKFNWDVQVVKKLADKNSASLEADIYWSSPDWLGPNKKPKPFVKEQTTIRVHSASTTHRMIDFTIRINALVPKLKLGGSANDKGYGGFSTRFQLNDSLNFSGAAGEVEPTRLPVEAGRWLDLSGTFNASAVQNVVAEPKQSGMTILCHPTIPGFPRPWILRRARSMQNPVFPGQTPVAVPMDQPLILRYRIVLHRGDVDSQTINQWQKSYSAAKTN